MRLAWLVAAAAALPLVTPRVWAGFRIELHTDLARGALSTAEQPLSVRSFEGVWAILLAVAWFWLAQRRRDVTTWETLLVLAGGGLALVRLGNAWLDGLALVPPLARQIGQLRLPNRISLVVAVACLVLAGSVLVAQRPPAVPPAVVEVVRATHSPGVVFADWRRAGDLERALGGDRPVLGAAGLAGSPTEYWYDYLRISQAHERWATILGGYQASVVVLDAADAQRAAAGVVRASADWRVLLDRDGVLVAEQLPRSGP